LIWASTGAVLGSGVLFSLFHLLAPGPTASGYVIFPAIGAATGTLCALLARRYVRWLPEESE